MAHDYGNPKNPGPLQEFRASFFPSDALHAVHRLQKRRDDGGNGITKAIREVQVGAVDVGRNPGDTLEVGQMSLETLEKGKGMGWYLQKTTSSLEKSALYELLPHLHLQEFSWVLYRFRDFL